MPSLAIAFKLASAHAILAAMAAEFPMGTTGLGYLFAGPGPTSIPSRRLAPSLVATVISVSVFLAAGWVEKKVREHYT